ncbi:DUF1800 domain-containing protein [Shimia sagamensis]|uniref:Uncharacterized conserved protein, DUF1800 family n=1 Tax=Shimia sagamensis TaxID=1566352 RepID=A0ABY1NSE0_9RHOB|nr:DUF1800 domain-containing protein [Shimia sagamensis]SMP14764.1 Uncharacterized conserved protein, DUF1800 family [Shimia sagamensis]
MVFDPDIAQTRFGYGRSPKVVGPQGVDEMLALLRAPEVQMPWFPFPSDAEMREKMLALLNARRKISKAEKGSDAQQALQKAFKTARRASKQEGAKWIGATLARRVWSRDGLRERLVAFWNDHFSAPGKNVIYRYTEPAYVANAIRPHVGGRFEDMLIAAVLHPQMLHFLDQNNSVGPNSAIAKKRPQKNLGLNENLAREILELHTLGVGGGYTQDDVRQLAELLTGVTTIQKEGTAYLSKRAEPGPETVLGKEYGTRRARVSDVHAVLRDLARHPDTARHITHKLAVHFVSDTPDEDLLVSMGARYLETDGDLAEVVEAMLRHSAAWAAVEDGAGNFKQPELFVSSALRALAVPKKQLRDVKSHQLERLLGTPLRTMGQPWRRPFGPDGFEEDDGHWLTAQGMAARLQWALGVPAEVLDALPDPRDFVQTTLGTSAPASVRFAAETAENRREGVALVLMSPAFQRV